MHIAKDDIDVKMNKPGAILRQNKDFGSVRGYDQLCAESFSLAAGVDTTPLCQGLEGDQCQSPHWGYIIKGRATVLIKTDEKKLLSLMIFFIGQKGIM